MQTCYLVHWRPRFITEAIGSSESQEPGKSRPLTGNLLAVRSPVSVFDLQNFSFLSFIYNLETTMTTNPEVFHLLAHSSKVSNGWCQARPKPLVLICEW